MSYYQRRRYYERNRKNYYSGGDDTIIAMIIFMVPILIIAALIGLVSMLYHSRLERTGQLSYWIVEEICTHQEVEKHGSKRYEYDVYEYKMRNLSTPQEVEIFEVTEDQLYLISAENMEQGMYVQINSNLPKEPLIIEDLSTLVKTLKKEG